MDFLCFQLENVVSESYTYLLGVFLAPEIDKSLETVSFAYSRNLVFWNLSGPPLFAVPGFFSILEKSWLKIWECNRVALLLPLFDTDSRGRAQTE